MKLSYQEQIERAIHKASKKLTPSQVTPEMLYHMQRFRSVACVSWEKFKGSCAYEAWIKEYYFPMEWLDK